MRRSHAPVFWLLFGAGGMLSALVGPVLVVITGIAVPLGLLPPDALDHAHLLALARHPLGKLALLAVVALSAPKWSICSSGRPSSGRASRLRREGWDVMAWLLQI